jgi:hypothetical protein
MTKQDAMIRDAINISKFLETHGDYPLSPREIADAVRTHPPRAREVLASMAKAQLVEERFLGPYPYPRYRRVQPRPATRVNP